MSFHTRLLMRWGKRRKADDHLGSQQYGSIPFYLFVLLGLSKGMTFRHARSDVWEDSYR